MCENKKSSNFDLKLSTMKKVVYSFILLAVMIYGCGTNNKNKNINPNASDLKGNIIVNGSDVLYPIAMKWAQAYKVDNPGVAIMIRSTGSENALRNLKAGKISLAMVSRELTDEEKTAGLIAFPIAMDMVVPVICFDNKNIQKIVMTGVSKQKLADAFTGKIKTWGQLLKTKSTDPIEIYKLADTTGTSETWANFLGVKSAHVVGTVMYANKSMADYIITKKFGLGYCSSSVCYDINTNFIRHNLMVVPTDLNANGQADDDELVFDKLDDLKTIIAEGKYPSPPTRKLYLVIKSQPANEVLKDFVKWTLGIGQNYCKEFCLVSIDKKSAQESIKLLK